MNVDVRPKVSALVVTYYPGRVIKECLAALVEENGVDEIVVINNGNHEEDRLWLAEFIVPDRMTYKFIDGHGNVGFATGINMGAREASHERLLIINPDAVIKIPSTHHLEAARANRSAPTLVGGKIFYPSGIEQRGGRRELLTPRRALVTYLGLYRLEGLFSGFRSLHREKDPEPEGPVSMPVISGALCYISAEDFWMIDGLDEGYFLHVEDIDICRRIAEAGGEVVYTPLGSAMHYGSTSQVSKIFVEKNKAKGLSRYFTKNAKTPIDRALASLSLFGFTTLLVGRSVLINTILHVRQFLIDLIR